MAKSEQQPRKGSISGKEPPAKKPSKLDKPGLPDEQLGKVAGGRSTMEQARK